METGHQRIFLKQMATSCLRSITPMSCRYLMHRSWRAARAWLTVLSLGAVSMIASPAFATPSSVLGLQTTPIITPQIERRVLKEQRLDDESMAIAVRGGVIGLTDFGSSGTVAAQLSYHWNEHFYLAADVAQAKAGLTSFEKLSGAAPLLTDAQREWRFIGAQLGYVLLPGEVFVGSDFAMNSAWSLFAGGGSVDFAGDSVFAAQFGSQFRLYVTDYLAIDLVVTDYVFETSILAEQKTDHNLSMMLGAAWYF